MALTYVVKKVVSSLNLIPVEEVSLTELQVLQVVLLDEGLPGHIKAGKQPAPSRTLLVCDRLALSLHLLVVNMDSSLQATEDNKYCCFYKYNVLFHLLFRQASRGPDLEQTFWASLFLSQE